MAFSYKTEPRPHQREALRKTATLPNAGLFMAPGTGKSFVTLNTAAYHYDLDNIDTLIVLTLNNVQDLWIEEQAPEHLGCPWVGAYYRAGSRRQDKEIAAVLAQTDRLAIVSANADMLSHPSGVARLSEWMSGRRVMLTSDESHLFKTPGAKRTRNLLKLGRTAVIKRILSGTSLTRGYEDLFAQFRFLNPDIVGCRTYTEFKTMFCLLDPNYHNVVGYQNLPYLFKRIEPYIYQCPHSVLNLPVPVWGKRKIPLTDEQRRLFTELRDVYTVELDGGQLVDAQHQLARLTKLQQIVAGHIRLEDGSWRPVPTYRIAAAVDIVQLVEHKVLIWCAWRPDVEQISAALTKAGVRHVCASGDLDSTECAESYRQFKHNDSVQVLVSTYGKTRGGHTFNDAKTAIFYSHTFSFDYREQSTKRNWRDGQLDHVNFYDFVSPGTTDAGVLSKLRHKESMHATIHDPTEFRKILYGIVPDPDLQEAA